MDSKDLLSTRLARSSAFQEQLTGSIRFETKELPLARLWSFGLGSVSIYYRLVIGLLGFRPNILILHTHVLHILLCLYRGSSMYHSTHWIYYTELFCSLSVSLFSLFPYFQNGIRATFLWPSLSKIRCSSSAMGFIMKIFEKKNYSPFITNLSILNLYGDYHFQPKIC